MHIIWVCLIFYLLQVGVESQYGNSNNNNADRMLRFDDISVGPQQGRAPAGAALLLGTCNETSTSLCNSPNGQCVQSDPTHYVCYCRRPTCSEDVDECNVNLLSRQNTPFCMNNAMCQNTYGSFMCECRPGYAGQYCEKRLAPCDMKGFCLHNGICVPETLSENDLFFGNYTRSHEVNLNFTCLCRNGYFGKRCEFDIKDCQLNSTTSCSSHGVCVESGVLGTHECQCEFPYRGNNCQLSPCDTYPCENGAQCFATNTTTSGYICQCMPGFTGERCRLNVNDCSNSVDAAQHNYTCNGRGVCVNDAASRTGYRCTCQSGFVGENCETSLGRCAAGATLNTTTNYNRCNVNGTLRCIDRLDDAGIGFECQCSPGYAGVLCDTQMIDYCQDNPGACEYGECISLGPAKYECRCPPGMYGPRCEYEDCSKYDCFNGGTCMITERYERYCVCTPGWSGSQCQVPENVCEMLQPCRNGAFCSNQVNNNSMSDDNKYTCYCAPDYYGNNCEFHLDRCSQLPCQNNGLCVSDTTDNSSSFRCECRPGFTGATCNDTLFGIVMNQSSLLTTTTSASQEEEIPLSVIILTSASYNVTPSTTTTTTTSSSSAPTIGYEEVAAAFTTTTATSAEPSSGNAMPNTNINMVYINITSNLTDSTTSIVSINSTQPLLAEIVTTNTTTDTSVPAFVSNVIVRNNVSSSTTTTQAPERFIIKPQQPGRSQIHSSPSQSFTNTFMPTTTASSTTTTRNSTSLLLSNAFRMPRLSMPPPPPSTSSSSSSSSGFGRASTRYYDPAAAAFTISRAARQQQFITNATSCQNGGALNAGRLPSGSVAVQCDCPIGVGDLDCSLTTRITPATRFLGYSYVTLPPVIVGGGGSNSNSVEIFMRVQPQLVTGLLFLLLESNNNPAGRSTTAAVSSSRGMLYMQNGTLIYEGRCGSAPDVVRVDSGIQLHTTNGNGNSSSGSNSVVYVRLAYPTRNVPICSVLIQVDDKRVQAEKRAVIATSSSSSSPMLLPQQIIFDGVYVGGHPNANPNFTGCISDFVLQGQEINLMRDAVFGWNVLPCGTIERREARILNNELVATTPQQCDLAQNPCREGSICLITSTNASASEVTTTPTCLCNATRHGQYCEREQLQPRQPRFFSGRSDRDDDNYIISYLEFPPTLARIDSFQLMLSFSLNGNYSAQPQLLVFIGSLDLTYAEYIAVLLRPILYNNDGTLTATTISPTMNAELHVKFGPNEFVLSRALNFPIVGQNHSITVNYTTTSAILLGVDTSPIQTMDLMMPLAAATAVTTSDSANSNSSKFFHALDSDGRIFLGNVPNEQMLPLELQQLNISGFRGCITDARFNAANTTNSNGLSLRLPSGDLLSQTAVDGRNVAECAGYVDWCAADSADSTTAAACGRYAHCSNIGASFRCTCYDNSTLAPNGRCRLINPCADNSCTDDSLCIAAEANDTGYRCVCPLGFDGEYCQNQINIGLPMFRGGGTFSNDDGSMSYVSLLNSAQQQQFCLSIADSIVRLHILPTAAAAAAATGVATAARFADGLLVYAITTNVAVPTIFALTLTDGRVEAHWSSLLSSNNDSATINLTARSDVIASTNDWIFIEVKRNPTTGLVLVVDGTSYTPLIIQSLSVQQLRSLYMLQFGRVFLGGLPSSSSTSTSSNQSLMSTSGVYAGFSGCMANVYIGERAVFQSNFSRELLSSSRSRSTVSGYGIGMCNSNECRSTQQTQCSNGGRCALERNSSRTVCECAVGYEGEQCQRATSCASSQCFTDSLCIETSQTAYRCSCPLGRAGQYCSEQINLTALSFALDASYLRIDEQQSNATTTPTPTNDQSNYIEFEFRPVVLSTNELVSYYFLGGGAGQLSSSSSTADDTLIMWFGDHDDASSSSCGARSDFIGIGLSGGRLKVVFNFGLDLHTTLVSNSSRWQWFDGSAWIRVALFRQSENVRVIINSTDGFQHEMRTFSTSSSTGGAGSNLTTTANLIGADLSSSNNANGIYYFARTCKFGMSSSGAAPAIRLPTWLFYTL